MGRFKPFLFFFSFPLLLLLFFLFFFFLLVCLFLFLFYSSFFPRAEAEYYQDKIRHSNLRFLPRTLGSSRPLEENSSACSFGQQIYIVMIEWPCESYDHAQCVSVISRTELFFEKNRIYNNTTTTTTITTTTTTTTTTAG